MNERELRSADEEALVVEWQTAFEEYGEENPLVEVFTYVLFLSYSTGRGRKRRRVARTVELVGKRGEKKRYQVKESRLPEQLERAADVAPGVTDYNDLLDKLRRIGKS